MIYGKTIQEWVVLINASISNKYGLNPLIISENDYGFSSMSTVIHAILSNIDIQKIYAAIQGTYDKSHLIVAAHKAWCENYIQWKNKTTETHLIALGTNPKKTINTHRRNDRATSTIEKLSIDDLKLYNDLIDCVINTLTQDILEAGMKNMKI